MTKFRRFAFAILVLCIVFTITVSSAETEIRYVYDDASVFSDDELKTLETELSKSSSGEVKYTIGTTNKYYYDRDELGDAFCAKHNIIQQDNLVLLIIDVSDNYETHYDIYTYGNSFNKITDAEIDRILYHNDVYDNLKSNNFLEGTLAFLKHSKTAYNGHLPMKPGSIVLISVLSGTIVSAIVCAAVFAKYKTKLKSTSYPIDKYAKLNLREKSDIFLGSSVTRVRVQSSSSGHSSRGGGGGHRGGA